MPFVDKYSSLAGPRRGADSVEAIHTWYLTFVLIVSSQLELSRAQFYHTFVGELVRDCTHRHRRQAAEGAPTSQHLEIVVYTYTTRTLRRVHIDAHVLDVRYADELRHGHCL